MKSAENTSAIPANCDSIARKANLLLFLYATKSSSGSDKRIMPSRIYSGFIFWRNDTSASLSAPSSSAGMAASFTASSSAATSSTFSEAMLFSTAASSIFGTNPIRMIRGTPMMNHHFPFPMYRHMHNETMLASTRIATKGENFNVKMNSTIAIPTMNISHPESPSLYSMKMNPTYTSADPVSL